MGDVTHLAGRIPDGQGHPGEAGRRHEAATATMRHDLAAMLYVDALARGDLGTVRQHLATLRHGGDIDPWRLLEHVAARASAHEHWAALY